MKKWAISYLCLKGKGAKVMFEVRNTIPYVGNILLIALHNYELHNGYLQTLTRIIQTMLSQIIPFLTLS